MVSKTSPTNLSTIHCTLTVSYLYTILIKAAIPDLKRSFIVLFPTRPFLYESAISLPDSIANMHTHALYESDHTSNALYHMKVVIFHTLMQTLIAESQTF